MGILDLFRPKWKHSDPEKRRVAVEKIEDEYFVNEVVWFSKHSDTILFAIERISDATYLEAIATVHKSKEAREAVVKKTSNRLLLEKIAKNDKDMNVRFAADARLAGLGYSNKSEEEFGVLDAPFIKDDNDETFSDDDIPQRMGFIDLFKPKKWKHSDPKVRLEAVREIEDQYLLTKIVLNDKNHKICLEALRKINKNNLLHTIAVSEKSEEICLDAIKKIEYQPTLYHSAKSRHYPYWIREAFLEKLKDQAILAEFVRSDPAGSMGDIALNKLKDQALVGIAIDKGYVWKGDYNKKFSAIQKAVNKIENQTLLAEIVKEANDEQIEEIALEKITDQEVIVSFAKYWDPSVRIYAVRKIEDQTVLADIAKNDDEDDVRKEATKKLESQAILANIDINKNDERIHRLVEMPEGTIYIFEDDVADPIHFHGIIREIVKKHCQGGIQGALLKGENRQIIAVLGREGSMLDFKSAFRKNVEVLWNSVGLPDEKIRPLGNFTNIADSGNYIADDSGYRNWLSKIQSGKYKVVEAYSSDSKESNASSKTDPNVCVKCGASIVFVSNAMELMSSTEAMLHNKAGCSQCGITVCFNCTAKAGEERGEKGHCYCPSCGSDLGRSGETARGFGAD